MSSWARLMGPQHNRIKLSHSLGPGVDEVLTKPQFSISRRNIFTAGPQADCSEELCDSAVGSEAACSR